MNSKVQELQEAAIAKGINPYEDAVPDVSYRELSERLGAKRFAELQFLEHSADRDKANQVWHDRACRALQVPQAGSVVTRPPAPTPQANQVERPQAQNKPLSLPQVSPVVTKPAPSIATPSARSVPYSRSAMLDALKSFPGVRVDATTDQAVFETLERECFLSFIPLPGSRSDAELEKMYNRGEAATAIFGLKRVERSLRSARISKALGMQSEPAKASASPSMPAETRRPTGEAARQAPYSHDQLVAALSVFPGASTDGTDAELWARLEKECFQSHIKIPQMASDEDLSKKHNRFDASKIFGMARVERGFKRDRLCKILGE